MLHHAAWAVGSCSSGPPAARTVGTQSTGGFYRPDRSPCSQGSPSERLPDTFPQCVSALCPSQSRVVAPMGGNCGGHLGQQQQQQREGDRRRRRRSGGGGFRSAICYWALFVLGWTSNCLLLAVAEAASGKRRRWVPPPRFEIFPLGLQQFKASGSEVKAT